jgi:hypothetical protein
MWHGFTYATGYTLTPATTSRAQLPSCVTPSLDYYPPGSHASQQQSEDHHQPGRLAQQDSSWALLRGYGNINPLSIDYASRPRLRPRLTQGGIAWPWNPWSSGGRVSHPAFATHACILTPTTSTAGSRRCFTGDRTLPYPPTHPNHTPQDAARHTCERHSFGGVLEPRYIVGAEPLDQ